MFIFWSLYTEIIIQTIYILLFYFNFSLSNRWLFNKRFVRIQIYMINFYVPTKNQIDSSTIDGNVQLYSDVTSVNLVFVTDKIINNSDNFRKKCLSYSKISFFLWNLTRFTKELTIIHFLCVTSCIIDPLLYCPPRTSAPLVKVNSTYIKHKVWPRQPCCSSVRYSTNWDWKGWPGPFP